MNEPNIRFPVLTGERFLLASDIATQQVLKRIEQPQFDHFKATRVDTYPAWFMRGVLALLGLVMLFSFIVSGGKQVAAAGLIFDNMSAKFNHLSALWSDISILSMLMLSELGAVLFLIASGTIGEIAPVSVVFGQRINITSWIFRGFALICAAYALVSNVTTTILDPVDRASFLQWIISIGIPCTVLGLGILLERIVIEQLKGQNEQKARYANALVTYEKAKNSPTEHPHYKRALFDSLYAEMTRYKADREKIGDVLPLAETDQNVKRWLVGSEYQAHQQMADFDMGVISSPFLPEITDG